MGIYGFCYGLVVMGVVTRFRTKERTALVFLSAFEVDSNSSNHTNHNIIYYYGVLISFRKVYDDEFEKF